MADVTAVSGVATRLQLRPSQIANGAVELLNEVSSGKITGEEDRYSHTDLADFEANVAGAQKAYVLLRPALIERKDGALVQTLNARFADVQKGLEPYRRSTPLGFALYGELTPKDRKTLAAALRPIYAAASAEAALAALDAFEDGEWGRKFPTVVAAWRRAWDQVIPFFTFPPEIRRVIYTTNAIESVNARVRKIIKTRGHFPTDDAANKLIWLALRNITAGWSNAAHNWKEAMNQFAILYDDRFNVAG